MSARSIKAGEAYVEGTFRDGKLVAGLKRGQGHLRAFANTAKSIGLQLAAAGAAITAPILASLNTFRKVGAQLDDMAKRTGASVRALSELRFAATQSGTSIESVETAIKGMQKNLLEAEQGGAAAIAMFAALGLSVDQLRGLKPEDQLALIASQLDRIEDPGLRAGMALKVLGKSGQELLPMLGQLGELRRQAREMGLSMSPEAAAAAAALDDTLDLLNRTFEGTRAAIGAAVAPLAVNFLQALVAVSAAATRWIQKNQEVVQSVAAIGFALVGLGSGTLAVAAQVNVVVKAIENLILAKKAWDAVGSVAAFAGIGTALGLIAGTVAVIAAATMDWFRAQNQVNAAIEEAKTKQTIGDSGKLGMAETRYNQLQSKGKLTESEKREAGRLGSQLRDEFGVDAGFNYETGRVRDSRSQMGVARGMRSVMAIRNDVNLQKGGLQIAAGQGETGAQIAEREKRLAETEEELATVRRIIADAKGKSPPRAPKIGGDGASLVPNVGGGIGAAADWMESMGKRGSQVAGSFFDFLEEQTRKAHERRDEMQRVDDEIARLRIANTKDGLDKDLALIEQRRQEQGRELKESGVFEGPLLEEMLAKIDQQAALEGDLARKGDTSLSMESAGTFQGSVAGQQLGGGSVAVDHLKHIREYAKRTADKLEADSGQTVGA